MPTTSGTADLPEPGPRSRARPPTRRPTPRPTSPGRALHAARRVPLEDEDDDLGIFDLDDYVDERPPRRHASPRCSSRTTAPAGCPRCSPRSVAHDRAARPARRRRHRQHRRHPRAARPGRRRRTRRPWSRRRATPASVPPSRAASRPRPPRRAARCRRRTAPTPTSPPSAGSGCCTTTPHRRRRARGAAAHRRPAPQRRHPRPQGARLGQPRGAARGRRHRRPLGQPRDRPRAARARPGPARRRPRRPRRRQRRHARAPRGVGRARRLRPGAAALPRRRRLLLAGAARRPPRRRRAPTPSCTTARPPTHRRRGVHAGQPAAPRAPAPPRPRVGRPPHARARLGPARSFVTLRLLVGIAAARVGLLLGKAPEERPRRVGRVQRRRARPVGPARLARPRRRGRRSARRRARRPTCASCSPRAAPRRGTRSSRWPTSSPAASRPTPRARCSTRPRTTRTAGTPTTAGPPGCAAARPPRHAARARPAGHDAVGVRGAARRGRAARRRAAAGARRRRRPVGGVHHRLARGRPRLGRRRAGLAACPLVAARRCPARLGSAAVDVVLLLVGAAGRAHLLPRDARRRRSRRGRASGRRRRTPRCRRSPGALSGGRLGTAAALVLLPWLARSVRGCSASAGRRPGGARSAPACCCRPASFTPVVWLVAVAARGRRGVHRGRERSRRAAAARDGAAAGRAARAVEPPRVREPALLWLEPGLVGPTDPHADVARRPAAAARRAGVDAAVARPRPRRGRGRLPRRARRPPAGRSRPGRSAWSALALGVVMTVVRVDACRRSDGPVAPWPGVPTAIWGGALIVARRSPSTGCPRLLAGRDFGWRQPSAAALIAVLVLAPLGALALLVVGVDGPLRRGDARVLPGLRRGRDARRRAPARPRPARAPASGVVYDLLAVPEPQTGDLDVAAPRSRSRPCSTGSSRGSRPASARRGRPPRDPRHPLRRGRRRARRRGPARSSRSTASAACAASPPATATPSGRSCPPRPACSPWPTPTVDGVPVRSADAVPTTGGDPRTPTAVDTRVAAGTGRPGARARRGGRQPVAVRRRGRGGHARTAHRRRHGRPPLQQVGARRRRRRRCGVLRRFERVRRGCGCRPWPWPSWWCSRCPARRRDLDDDSEDLGADATRRR